MYTTLWEIEKKYLEKVRDTLNNGRCLTAELLVEISITLFSELKIKDISDSEYEEDDMLLYQYGISDWCEELGEHFSLDITRQFSAPEQDEPYQLSFALIYEPEQFKDIGSYDCWSDEYASINSFADSIKETDGFKLAAKNVPRTYQIYFSQV